MSFASRRAEVKGRLLQENAFFFFIEQEHVIGDRNANRSRNGNKEPALSH